MHEPRSGLLLRLLLCKVEARRHTAPVKQIGVQNPPVVLLSPLLRLLYDQRVLAAYEHDWLLVTTARARQFYLASNEACVPHYLHDDGGASSTRLLSFRS